MTALYNRIHTRAAKRMRPGITGGLLPLQSLVELVDDSNESIALSRRHSGALRTEHFGERISRFPRELGTEPGGLGSGTS